MGHPPDANFWLGFGASVSVYENDMAVGAFGDDDVVNNGGSVYMYKRTTDSQEWELQEEIHAPDATTLNSFGCSVSLYENTLAVGAMNDDDAENGLTDAGSVYLYERVNSHWELQEEIHAPDAAEFNLFGTAVSLFENGLAVSTAGFTAFGDDTTPDRTGAVHIYESTIPPAAPSMSPSVSSPSTASSSDDNSLGFILSWIYFIKSMIYFIVFMKCAFENMVLKPSRRQRGCQQLN